ncbi:hypothetical protein [Asticcacaulis sp. W401b]|uniref:hypothetical protein n=1 Tax=Asticcacaulis sp. W401b TaxID=3388666 RepID=UPI003970A1CE
MPVLLGWAFICLSLVLWSTAYHPIVGIPFGVLAVMVIALGFIVRNGDWRGVLHRPEAARAGSAEPDASPSWPGVAARSLAALIVAPATGMCAGLLMWLWMPGHEATRFVWAVFGFVVVFAVAQLWGLSARRPWRALGLMSAAGFVSALPTLLTAGGLR